LKKTALIILFLSIFIDLKAQNIKGLYVDGFKSILGNTLKEDSLLRFTQNNGFNYLTLYQVHLVNANTPLNNAAACTVFTNFISKAKTQYGILQIGVAGENYNFFANNIFPYNQQHTLQSQKIDVYNVEFEYWVPSSIQVGGVYCVDYLTSAGYSCDSTGAFNYYKKMLQRIDSLANAGGSISETYFGWFSTAEGAQIMQTGVDRILLSVYLPSANYSPSYQFNYIKGRLQNLTSANKNVKVMPIYSAEPNFMQTWTNSNPFFKPYADLQNNLKNETANWKNFIQLEGIQWFAYTDMPKINLNTNIQQFFDTENQVIICPNPANDFITIESEITNGSIEIMDCQGRLVYTKNKIVTNEKIDISRLNKGWYVLKLSFENNIFYKKIIVL
jgi:Secretion system C-terminal sorting domain